MKKAGAIISLVTGVFCIILATITIYNGVTSVAFSLDYFLESLIGQLGLIAGVTSGIGWGRVVFSLLVILFSTLAISAKGRIPGVLLIISSFFGFISSGDLIAVLMVPAFIGGFLTISENKSGGDN